MAVVVPPRRNSSTVGEMIDNVVVSNQFVGCVALPQPIRKTCPADSPLVYGHELVSVAGRFFRLRVSSSHAATANSASYQNGLTGR